MFNISPFCGTGIKQKEVEKLGRDIQFHEKELTLRLSGLTGLFTLKSSINIPYDTIQKAVVDYFEPPKFFVRMGVIIPPLNIYQGSFKRSDKWYFLSFERREQLVIIELGGHEKYDYVVFQSDQPSKVVSDINSHVM